MKQERINELFEDYAKALKRLEEALHEDPSKSSAIIDGTIQRFEFTFELAWKLMGAYLAHQGKEAPSPRKAIKEAFKEKLIRDGKGWIGMLEDRNKTSHIYDEPQAMRIYGKIKKQHVALLKAFKEKMGEEC